MDRPRFFAGATQTQGHMTCLSGSAVVSAVLTTTKELPCRIMRRIVMPQGGFVMRTVRTAWSGKKVLKGWPLKFPLVTILPPSARKAAPPRSA